MPNDDKPNAMKIAFFIAEARRNKAKPNDDKPNAMKIAFFIHFLTITT